jgi:aminoglycoside phosphotransferase (APT) family kinase protein
MIDRSEINKLLELLRVKGEVIDLQPLNGGVSASMTLVTTRAADNNTKKWVVRQLSGETLSIRPYALTIENSLMKILHHHQIPVPIPVHLDERGEVFGIPTLLLEYLEGEMDFSPRSLPGRIEELAGVVAKIHTVTLDEIRDTKVPKLSSSIEQLCGDLREMPDEFIEETNIREKLKMHWPPRYRNPDSLLHGDIWNGNILWRGGHISGIIDWEDAWIGDPLLDVAGVRLDLACEFGFEYAEQFTACYTGLIKIDTRCLPQWDLVASLWFARFINEDFVNYPDFFQKYGRADITLDHFRQVTKRFAVNSINHLETYS